MVKRQVRLGAGDLFIGEGTLRSLRARRARVLVAYYLDPPWDPLLALEMLLLSLVTAIDLLAATSDWASKDAVVLGTSFLFAVVVAGNEMVAARWRRRRDRRLEQPPDDVPDYGEIVALIAGADTRQASRREE